MSFAQIKKYLEFLSRRKRIAPRTFKTVVHALHYYFNDVLNRDYPIKQLPRPKVEIDVPEILAPSEVLAIIEDSPNLRHKAMFAIIYSAGLETSEATKLRLQDVDFKNRLIYIQQTRGKGLRRAPLSDYVSEILYRYIDEYAPKKWLFEGSRQDSQMGPDAIQKAFKRMVRNLGIEKDVTPRSLRHSYIKHLEYQGVPLSNILDNLGIWTPSTLYFYARIGHEPYEISFSPIDRILGNDKTNLPSVVAQDKIYLALKAISNKLGNSYAQVKADLRSDVRLSWAGTAHEIREIVATLLRELAPDDKVKSQPWYIQEPNTSRPTQRQRVRYILQSRNASSNEKKIAEQVTGIDEMVGLIVRGTYSRASDAAHRFKEKNEVLRILKYFEAFAYDLLNING